MKKLIFTFLCLISLSAFAQTDTAVMYVNYKMEPVSRDKAITIFRSYQKDSATWVFLVSNMHDQLIKKETYGDPNLTILNGPYVEYVKAKPSLKGLYVNNKRSGNFISYDTLGNVKEVNIYENDTLNGPHISYWDNNAKRVTGTYTKGSKTGEWLMYYEDGKTAMKEIFNEKGKLTDSLFLDTNGLATTRFEIESPPRFPGGLNKFYQYLGENIKYPNEAAEKNITGDVFLEVTINEQGIIDDVKVTKKLSPSQDAEAVRVLKASPKWIPGTFKGKKVKVTLNLPIRFRIQY